MTRRTPRRRGQPRCDHCAAALTFFTITFSTGTSRLPFDAKPIGLDEDHFAARAYPVMGQRAWDYNELLAEIQVMRGVDVDEARDEIKDMPWHQLHRCLQGSAAKAAERRQERLQEREQVNA